MEPLTSNTPPQLGGVDKAMATDVLLKEDLIMKYLELIVPEDRFLLNLPFIHEKGEKYIDYWQNSVYPKYKDELRNLVSRYTNRRKYQIKAVSNAVHVIPVVSNKPEKKSKTETTKPIASIDKPVFMDINTVLHQGRNSLQSKRAAIKMQYEHLMSKHYLDEKDKARYTKQREVFLTHLNEFYAVQYYSNKINNFVIYNKNIAIPMVKYFNKTDVKQPVPRVDSVDINVNNELINQLFEQEGHKLDIYNQILEMQSRNDPEKDINTLIKSYLQYDTTNDIMKSINSKLYKLKNYKNINWLVVPTKNDRPEFCKHAIPFFNNSSQKSIKPGKSH